MGNVHHVLLFAGGGICHVLLLWLYLYLISACALLCGLTLANPLQDLLIVKLNHVLYVRTLFIKQLQEWI